MTDTRSAKIAREIGSVPGAGDILTTPKALERRRKNAPSSDAEKVTPDPYDAPAASGIGENPNRPMVKHDDAMQSAREFVARCDGSVSAAREALQALAKNPASEFVAHVGGIDAAFQALEEVESA